MRVPRSAALAALLAAPAVQPSQNVPQPPPSDTVASSGWLLLEGGGQLRNTETASRFVAAIRRAKGVWFYGGDEERLVDRYVGTSAGAMILAYEAALRRDQERRPDGPARVGSHRGPAFRPAARYGPCGAEGRLAPYAWLRRPLASRAAASRPMDVCP